ncbi:hypothetical protein [Streptomyces sp. NPDC005890]|uniref:hypothetical protein n=1 Tax=Streptomyces sp. NPDC005890 TaxID=3154568 RepID=UPI0033D74417
MPRDTLTHAHEVWREVGLHATLVRHPWLIQAIGSHLLYGPRRPTAPPARWSRTCWATRWGRLRRRP